MKKPKKTASVVIAFGNVNQNYYAFSEKEREQYEKRITHLEEEILFLRNQLERKEA